MKIRRITTAGAPLGVATQMGGLSGTSRVTAGIDLFGSWGFDRVPELPPRPEHVLGEETREHRRTQARQEQSSLAGPAEDERESR
ncbi:MAG TPA: hypothetical protein VI365_19075 [Trebonia sp.]